MLTYAKLRLIKPQPLMKRYYDRRGLYLQVMPHGMRMLPKYCVTNTIKSQEYVNLVTLKKDLNFYITCIAREQALPSRLK